MWLLHAVTAFLAPGSCCKTLVNTTNLLQHTQGLQVLRLDTNWAVAHAPQLMQAGCAAVTDIYVYKLAFLLFGKPNARCGSRVAGHFPNDRSPLMVFKPKVCCRWTLLCQLTNWFNAYCLVRTYSNSFEALCTILGVFYWLASNSTRFTQPVELSHSNHRVQSKAEYSSSDGCAIQPVHSPRLSKQGAWPGVQPKHSPACWQQGQHQLTQPCSCINKPACLAHTGTTTLLMTDRQKALWAAAVGVLFRPSSLLFWLPLGETNPYQAYLL